MISLEAVNWVISRVASDSGLVCMSDAAGISLHFQEGCLCTGGSYLASVTEHDEVLEAMGFVMLHGGWLKTYPVHLGT